MMEKIKFSKDEYTKRHHSGYEVKKQKNDKFKLIAGPCAIEDQDTGFQIAERVKSICEELDISYIFKASYKKPIGQN